MVGPAAALGAVLTGLRVGGPAVGAGAVAAAALAVVLGAGLWRAERVRHVEVAGVRAELAGAAAREHARSAAAERDLVACLVARLDAAQAETASLRARSRATVVGLGRWEDRARGVAGPAAAGADRRTA